MNYGMAIEDVAVAQLALQQATRLGVGIRLPFIASPEEVFEF